MVCVWRLVLATFACVGKSEGLPAPTAKPVATPARTPPVTAPNCDAAEALAAQSEAARLAAEKERDAAEAARLPAEAALTVAKRERDAAVAARDAAETRATQCESDQTGSTGAIDVTDGCERNWLFQVSTGRSGSTSLMDMLNDLPNVYIAGENDGVFESLYALHKSSIRTEKHSKNGAYHGAWWHHPVERSKLKRSARTYVESAIGLKQNQNYTWVGFKEIRFGTADELDYLLSLFPCSKVIVNIRRNIVRQHESAFKEKIPISKLESQNDMLLKWSKKYPKRVFTLALEDFNLDNLNRLAVWLDFPNCRFKQIAHANRDGGYGADKRHFVTC